MIRMSFKILRNLSEGRHSMHFVCVLRACTHLYAFMHFARTFRASVYILRACTHLCIYAFMHFARTFRASVCILYAFCVHVRISMHLCIYVSRPDGIKLRTICVVLLLN
jgi:hypothetical protein